jgi:hypothetical protein
MTNTPPPPPPDANDPNAQGSPPPPPPPPDPVQQQQPQQYAQPAPTGAPGDPVYTTQPQPHPRGTTILILGILSLFCFGIVLGTIAFIMGNNALKEIDANPSAYTNRSTVNAGRIIGLIGAILSVITIIIFAAAG